MSAFSYTVGQIHGTKARVRRGNLKRNLPASGNASPVDLQPMEQDFLAQTRLECISLDTELTTEERWPTSAAMQQSMSSTLRRSPPAGHISAVALLLRLGFALSCTPCTYDCMYIHTYVCMYEYVHTYCTQTHTNPHTHTHQHWSARS